jgi:type IV secretory pathway VirD2 relaxase
MRLRAQAIVSLELGPRTDREIEDRLRREVDQERLTSLDRGLVREAGDVGQVQDTAGERDRDNLRHALKVGRLRKLERLGLARRNRRACSGSRPTSRTRCGAWASAATSSAPCSGR